MKYQFYSTQIASQPLEVSIEDVCRLMARLTINQSKLIGRAEYAIKRGDYVGYYVAKNDFIDNRDALLSPIFREFLSVEEVSEEFPAWSDQREEIDVPFFDDGEFEDRFIDDWEEAEQFGATGTEDNVSL